MSTATRHGYSTPFLAGPRDRGSLLSERDALALVGTSAASAYLAGRATQRAAQTRRRMLALGVILGLALGALALAYTSARLALAWSLPATRSMVADWLPFVSPI